MKLHIKTWKNTGSDKHQPPAEWLAVAYPTKQGAEDVRRFYKFQTNEIAWEGTEGYGWGYTEAIAAGNAVKSYYLDLAVS